MQSKAFAPVSADPVGEPRWDVESLVNVFYLPALITVDSRVYPMRTTFCYVADLPDPFRRKYGTTRRKLSDIRRHENHCAGSG